MYIDMKKNMVQPAKSPGSPFYFLLIITVMLAAVHNAANAQTGSVKQVEVVFLIDETRSVANNNQRDFIDQRDFIGEFATTLEREFRERVGITSRFGVVGFGREGFGPRRPVIDPPPNDLEALPRGQPRSIPVGGDSLGTVAGIDDALDNLETTRERQGREETGYWGLHHVLDTIDFTPGASTERVIVLITDADRTPDVNIGDEMMPGPVNADDQPVDSTSGLTIAEEEARRRMVSGYDLTTDAVFAMLEAARVQIHGILLQPIREDSAVERLDDESNPKALALRERDGQRQFFTDQDDDGVPERQTGGFSLVDAGQVRDPDDPGEVRVPGEREFTERDYVEPILSRGGCIGDLREIRRRQFNRNAFSVILADCVAGQPIRPLPPIIPLYGSIITRLHYTELMLRLSGRLHGTDYGHQSRVDVLSALAGAVADEKAGAFSADESAPAGAVAHPRGPVRFFANAAEQSVEVEPTGILDGFGQDGWRITIGADVDLSEDALAGIAYSYAKADAKADHSSSTVDTRTRVVSLYAGARRSEDKRGWYGGYVSHAWHDYDLRRANTEGTATASPDAKQFSFGAETGYDFEREENVTVTPAFGLHYTDLDVDDYTESGFGATTVSDEDYTSLTAVARLKIADRIPLKSGRTLVPAITLSATYALDELTDTVTITTPGPTALSSDRQFQYRSGEFGRSALLVNPGLAIINDTGTIAARLDYEAGFSDEVESHAVIFRLRFTF